MKSKTERVLAVLFAIQDVIENPLCPTWQESKQLIEEMAAVNGQSQYLEKFNAWFTDSLPH